MIGNIVEQARDTNIETLEVLFLICKIFYMVNNMNLVSSLKNLAALKPWIYFFKSILDMEVPQEIGSYVQDMDTIEERDKEILWKLKAKAGLILYHLVSGYGWSEYVFCMV